MMKRFFVLVPLVTVGLLVSGLTAAGSAAAGVSHGAGGGRGAVHVIDLRAGFAARLGRAVVGQAGGYEYPVGMGPISGRGGNECPEPYCPVSYGGGPVQLDPHVYLLLWGPAWSSNSGEAATASYLENFYSGLGVQPEDNWSTVTSQYGDSSGDPTFTSAGVYQGVWQDTNPPPTGVDATGLAAEADTFASSQGITDLADAQIVVATQSGTCPAGFYAPSVCGSDGGYYCSWHDYSNEPFINLPYILDAGTSCGEDFVNHSTGTYDGFTMSAGHEYAETITDPQPETAWWDPNDESGGEIADKCAWSSISSNVALSTGSFAMQPLWSNSANNTNGACVMHAGSGTDSVAVASPGDQSTYQGSALSLYVSGTSSADDPLTWSATGLPAGLTISPTGTPGVISGQIKVSAAPGTYVVTLEVSDSTGSSALTSFDWTVKADVGDDVTNQASGLCLNDYDYSITPGNHVVVYKCLDGPAEKFTHPSKTHELIVLGQCMTDSGKGGAGAPQVVQPCTGVSDQVWYYNSRHEWVLAKNLLCLTDPDGSTVNGTPVEIEKCTNAKDQLWSGAL
jgi:Putative Ig domain/Ricin-type beta-trefoil lectin domain